MAMAENYAKAERYIRDAAARGAKLAVLPEYYVTGWCPEHERWGDILEDDGWVDKFSVSFFSSHGKGGRGVGWERLISEITGTREGIENQPCPRDFSGKDNHQQQKRHYHG